MKKPPLERLADTSALQATVLYIEDDKANFALVESLLSIHPGIRLIEAKTGHEGISWARSDKPDLILLDMHLPDISGIEVVRRLSENIAAGHFRVILLTGDKFNIDIVKAMSLGAFEYLIKPANPLTLRASIERALSAKARGRR